jgi:threonine synthase
VPWTHANGLSAFEALLPVRAPHPGYWDDVGDTPVTSCPSLSELFGVELRVKHEGGNPSGSFKDRGLSVAVALGAACGARRFCLPTQGNAGVAAALFSARAGLEGAVVAMPEGYQGSPYHRLAELFGAEVRFGGSSIAQAGTLLRTDLADELAAGAIVDVSTFFEPGRLEGKKTMGLEIVRDLRELGLPDVILYPTGGGTGLVGLAKAFAECQTLGLLSDGTTPRLVAVQIDRCAPVVAAWDRGADRVDPVNSNGTIADGLDVPGAIMGHGILQAMRTTGGRAVAVSEDELLPAARLAGRHGLPVGLESAALVAALGRLRDDGFVTGGARVLLLVTSGPAVAVAQRRL